MATPGELLRPRLAEPLIAAAAFARVEQVATPPHGGRLRRGMRLRGRRLPAASQARTLVAVTAGTVHVFDADATGRPGREVATWSRATLGVEVTYGPSGPARDRARQSAGSTPVMLGPRVTLLPPDAPAVTLQGVDRSARTVAVELIALR